MRKGTIQQPPDSMNESIVLQTPDIIVLCVIIIIMCIIVMEQKNLVSEQEIGRDMSAREQVSRIAKLAFVVILTPELVLAATYRDYCSVRNSHSEILIKGNHAVLVASRDTDLKPELHFGGVDLPRLLSREVVIQLRQAERSSPATTSNSSLLVEGHAKESIPILLLPWVVKVGRDSAHPLFAKWMMTAQVIWSSLEVLSRFVNASSVTPLEMSAAAYMVCSITAYYIWRQQLPEIERHLSQPIKARRIDEPGTDRLWQQTQHRDISSLKDIETMILFSDSWRWGLCFGGFIFGTLHLAAWDIYFPTVHSKQLWRMSCLALMSPLVLLILYRGFYKPVARNFGYLTSGKETPAALAKLSMFTMYLYICARSFLFFQSFRSWGFPANVD
jgi:hypothetical protein